MGGFIQMASLNGSEVLPGCSTSFSESQKKCMIALAYYIGAFCGKLRSQGEQTSVCF